MLVEWSAAQAKLPPVTEISAGLTEAKPLVENWRALNDIGLEVITDKIASISIT